MGQPISSRSSVARLPTLATALAVAWLLAAAAPPSGNAATAPPVTPPLPRGAIVEKIVAAGDPSETYALYLPAAYDPTRRWPIVYLFDARGHAMIPAERFREAAETYGYILASSYNSASDGPFEPNLKAMQAMWKDTHGRLALDDKRVYAAGFSGTVRSSCILALAVPGSIVGIIGAGAGFPPEKPPTAKTPFIFFGTVGNLDFNFDEMSELDETLEDLHIAHRIEEFAGPHDWMPADLALLSIQWVEIQGMKSGARPRDPQLVSALLEQDLAKARSLEIGGDRRGAWHRYQAIAEEFAGLADVAGATAKAAELAAAKDVKAVQRLRRELRERDRQYVEDSQRTLAAADPESGPVNLPRLFAELKISELRARAAKDPTSEPALAAKRLLNTLGAQVSFYLPQLYLERKNYRRAELAYAVAAELYPERPHVWYNLAAMKARNGARKKALDDLQHAIELGFDDSAALANDESFASLRDDPTFRGLLVNLHSKAPAGSG